MKKTPFLRKIKQSSPGRRIRMRSTSTRRAKELLEYLKHTRPNYLLNHPICECGCGEPSTQVHHKKGRTGRLLNDVRFFMAVTDECQIRIHDNPTDSYAKGFMLDRLATV